MACAVSLGKNGVMQAVRNLRPWARACLTRMGAAFELDFKVPDCPSLVQSNAINSYQYRICIIYCAFMPSEKP